MKMVTERVQKRFRKGSDGVQKGFKGSERGSEEVQRRFVSESCLHHRLPTNQEVADAK
jgi:hypothetical protein